MASRLRIATWNINNGVLEKNADPGLLGPAYIANCIRSINSDIVCLQEVPMAGDSPDVFIEDIAGAAKYAYFRSLKLSASHLTDGDMGLAILSRTPIDVERAFKFPNPNLVGEHRGVALESHDKGVLCIKTRVDGHELAVVCLHLIPFHLFRIPPDSEELEPTRHALRSLLSRLGALPVVMCGDFNIESLEEFSPGLADDFGLSDLIHQATHQMGNRPDHIYHTPHFENNSAHIIKSLSDHHLCVADLNFSNGEARKGGKGKMDRKIADDEPVHILHLSDLHFGTGEAEYGDTKLEVDHAPRFIPREVLISIIENGLPRAPDFVVVSGDITIKGCPEGWEKFAETVKPLIRSGKLPAANRWVIVPGNHDVQQTLSSAQASSEAARWRPFVAALGQLFPRPWIPAVDGDDGKVIRTAELSMTEASSFWGGIYNSTDPVTFQPYVSVSPFIFDRERRVLIYAFNSACISGTTVKIPENKLQAINGLRGMASAKKNASLRILFAEFDRLRQVDAARIDPRELELFRRLMKCIETRHGGLDGVLKIAVLHHHVAPIYPEEMKAFEPLSNAALFKSALVERQFQLILHGHKHWGEPFVDTAIPYGGALLVVSGATIGGYSAQPRHPGFFWLSWHRSRSVVGTRFVQARVDRSADNAFVESDLKEFKVDDLLSCVGGVPLHPTQPPQRFDVRVAFRGAEAALESMVRTDRVQGQDRTLTGWSHRLTMANVSTIATAYGLRILAITGLERPGLRSLVPDILDSLRSVQIDGGAPGWSSSSQGRFAQPEATCWVLDALASYNALPTDGAAMLERMLERSDDKVTLRMTFSVALIIRTLCKIHPRSSWIGRLATLLVNGATRDGAGQILCWGRSLTDYRNYPPNGDNLDLAIMEPSVVHTAHALIALVKSQSILPPAHLPGLQASYQWLLAQEWGNTEEPIQRRKGSANYDQLTVNHFVLPWATLALLHGVGKEVEKKVSASTQELWKLRGKDGLWSWNGVDRPVWATHDALLALREAALAGVALSE